MLTAVLLLALNADASTAAADARSIEARLAVIAPSFSVIGPGASVGARVAAELGPPDIRLGAGLNIELGWVPLNRVLSEPSALFALVAPDLRLSFATERLISGYVGARLGASFRHTRVMDFDASRPTEVSHTGFLLASALVAGAGIRTSESLVVGLQGELRYGDWDEFDGFGWAKWPAFAIALTATRRF